MINSFYDRNKCEFSETDFSKRVMDNHLIENGPKSLTFYSHVYLVPGEEVHMHQHIGDSESYYILSGKGLFNDNGTLREVKKGDLCFTADGESHNLTNTGDEILEFIALTIKE